MNTKGIKFLAVLAVLAMAFAALAFIPTTDDTDAEIATTPEYTSPGGSAVDTYLMTSTGNTLDGTKLVYVNATGVTVTTVSGPSTIYVKAGASVTLNATLSTTNTITIIAVSESETGKVLSKTGVELKFSACSSMVITVSSDGKTVSLNGTSATILSGTIPAGSTVEIAKGNSVITVAGELKLNGKLDNNATDTTHVENGHLIVNGASAKITGSGVLAGKASSLVNVYRGELTGITVSQADWIASATGNGNEMIKVNNPAGDISIHDITVKMKTVDDKSHGICLNNIGNYKAEIKNITFTSVDDSTVVAEYLVNFTGVNNGEASVKNISYSKIKIREGYGELTLSGVTSIGNKATFDSTIKLIRITDACQVDGNVTVEKTVFRVNGTLTVKDGKQLSTNIISDKTVSTTGLVLNAGGKFTGTFDYYETYSDEEATQSATIDVTAVATTNVYGGSNGIQVESASEAETIFGLITAGTVVIPASKWMGVKSGKALSIAPGAELIVAGKLTIRDYADGVVGTHGIIGGGKITSSAGTIYAGGNNNTPSNMLIEATVDISGTAELYGVDLASEATGHKLVGTSGAIVLTNSKFVSSNINNNTGSAYKIVGIEDDASAVVILPFTLLATDTVEFAKGTATALTITVKTNDIIIPAGCTMTVGEGVTVTKSGSEKITNNGTIDAATAAVVPLIIDEASTGKLLIAGEEYSSEVKVDDSTTAWDSTTFDKDVMIATSGEVATAEIPAGKTLIVPNANSMTAITVKDSGATAAITLTDLAADMTVSNGTTSGSSLKIKAGASGTLTISYGSVDLNLDDFTGDIYDATGDVKIHGTASGPITINTTTSATLYVEDGKTLNIPAGIKLTLGAGISMNNDGTLVGGGTIEVEEDAQFYTAKPISVFLTGDGKIITDDSMETLKISDKLASSMVTNPTQKVLVTGNLVIKSGQYLVITGELEIPEGVTVTIEEGGLLMIKDSAAYAEIYGTIKASGKSVNTTAEYNGKAAFTVTDKVTKDVNVYGQIIAAKGTVDNTKSVEIKGTTNVEGSIIVNVKAAAEFDEVYVSDEGALTVNGNFSGKVYNSGLVTVNGGITGAATINMWAAGAIVDIQALKSEGLTITDVGMYLITKEGTKYNVQDGYQNELTLQNIGGIKITEDISYYTYEDERQASNLTYLSGTAGFGDSKVSKIPTISITKGYVTVADALDLAKAQLNVGANLVVYGTIAVDNSEANKLADNTPFYSDITITANWTSVYGMITVAGNSLTPASESHMNAVKYEKRVDLKNVYYYTTLKAAIDSGEKEFEVLGTLNVYVDTTIPAGITVDAAGKTVNVGDLIYGPDAVLTVSDGANLTAGTINVVGTLDIKNTDTGINCNNIISDTSNIGESDALYTNIYFALASAESGDEVKITSKNGIVYLARDVTVPEGATLIVPSSKELGVLVGATLTVDGELKAQGAVNAYAYNKTTKKYDAAVFAEKAATGDDAAAAISVNGLIESSTNMTFAKYQIPGAYFTYKTRFFITSLPNSALVINDADARTIDVYGDKMAYGNVAYEGTINEPVVVNIMDSVSSGTITIEYGTVNLAVNAANEGYDMKIAGANGTVTLAGVKVTTKAVFDASADDDGEEYIALMAGVFEENKKSTLSATSKKMTFDGEFGIAGSTIYKPTFKGDIELAKAVSITGAANVSGSLYVNNEATVTAASTLTVTGSVVVAEATTSKSAGKMTVADNIYIGASASVLVTSDVAFISGDVKGGKAYFVFDGAMGYGKITEYIQDLIDAKQYTEFYVEDELLMTVYDNSGSVQYATKGDDDVMSYLYYPKELENCFFVAWQYVSSGELKNITKTVKVGDASGYNKVYALINYYIYDVTIYTDAGVKAVSIDGIELFNEETNKFVLPGVVQLMAGTHTVTYTMKAGYSGTPTLKTVDGTILKDYKFITDGIEIDDLFVTLQLSGTEPTPEPEPEPTPTPEEKSEWTITTILLCVLVVLIAIMAVIVALRLNRN